MAAIGMVAACGTTPPAAKPAPGTFHDRVLNPHNLPPELPGFYAVTEDTSTMPPSLRANLLTQSAGPDGHDCGASFTPGNAVDQGIPVTDVAITQLNGHVGATAWSGTETLARYAGDGATRAMAELRKVAARCATFTDPLESGTVTITDAAYGDEAVLLKIRTTSSQIGNVDDQDAIVAQVGDCLLVIAEDSTTLTLSADDTALQKVTTAAITVYNGS